jgi:peroxin-6
MLYLGLSDTHDAQLQLLQALTRKFKLDPGLDLMRIAKCCPLNLTGADFYALCSDAMLKAMTRKTEVIDRTIGASSSTAYHLTLI